MLVYFELGMLGHACFQGLIQVVFNIGIPILDTIIWVCLNLILSKTETIIKRNFIF